MTRKDFTHQLLLQLAHLPEEQLLDRMGVALRLFDRYENNDFTPPTREQLVYDSASADIRKILCQQFISQRQALTVLSLMGFCRITYHVKEICKTCLQAVPVLYTRPRTTIDSNGQSVVTRHHATITYHIDPIKFCQYILNHDPFLHKETIEEFIKTHSYVND